MRRGNGRVERLYTKRAGLYKLFFIDLLQWEKVLEKFFIENDTLQPGMKILDAGCGTGPVTRVLYGLARERGFEEITFHGFDLTPAMLDLFQDWVKKEGAEGVQLLQANVLEIENQLPKDWNGYDLIISSAMLEYIPKDQISLALTNLRQLLKQDGHLLVFVTKRTWIARWTGAKLWGTNLFDPNEVKTDLRQAGFTTIQFKKLQASWDTFMLAAEAKSG